MQEPGVGLQCDRDTAAFAAQPALQLERPRGQEPDEPLRRHGDGLVSPATQSGRFHDAGTDSPPGCSPASTRIGPSKDSRGRTRCRLARACLRGICPFATCRDSVNRSNAICAKRMSSTPTMGMQGMMLPSAGTLHRSNPDERSVRHPLPRVHLHYGQNEIAMARDMMGTCGEIISAAGGQVFLQPSTVSPETLGLDYNHYAGTARMGRDTRTSVVDPDGCSHDVSQSLNGQTPPCTASKKSNAFFFFFFFFFGERGVSSAGG